MSKPHDDYRINEWIESQFWNAKIKGEKIYDEKIVAEIQTLFNSGIADLYREEDLKQRVKKIKSWVDGHYQRWDEHCKDLAERSMLPGKLIRMCYMVGLLNYKDLKANENEFKVIQSLKRRRTTV